MSTDDTTPSAGAEPHADAGPDADADALAFGPGGYLPERASKRARKIVLRAPMGIQWVIASLVVGVIVIVAGVLALRDSGPQVPFEVVADVRADGGTERSDDLLLLLDGRPRVFQHPAGADVELCAANGLLEQPDGGVWRTTGRGLDGTPSLVEHPSVVFEAQVWADLSTTLATPSASDEPVERACS